MRQSDKMVKHTQFVGKCLSVFEHFVGLELNRLTNFLDFFVRMKVKIIMKGKFISINNLEKLLYNAISSSIAFTSFVFCRYL